MTNNYQATSRQQSKIDTPNAKFVSIFFATGMLYEQVNANIVSNR